MPLVRIDKTMVKGDYLFFVDQGPVSKGARTHKFAVHSRFNKSFLGYVRFYSQWRQYTFNTINAILNKDCLREAALFCEEATVANRARREAFPAPASEPVVEAVTET